MNELSMLNRVDSFWRSQFSGCDPLAHELKHQFSSRWVRFHSLPESRRYAQDENDYLEILNRQNSLLTDLCEPEENLIVVLPEYADKASPNRPEKVAANLLPETVYWTSIDQTDNDGLYFHLHVSHIQQNTDELEALLRCVADDEVRNVMLLCLSSASVFHPYDGGVDIIVPTTELRDALKARYRRWLSGRPNGL